MAKSVKHLLEKGFKPVVWWGRAWPDHYLIDENGSLWSVVGGRFIAHDDKNPVNLYLGKVKTRVKKKSLIKSTFESDVEKTISTIDILTRYQEKFIRGDFTYERYRI